MGRLLWLLCLVGACYSPTLTDGLPCTDHGKCPVGLMCDSDTNTCVSQLPPAAVLTSISAGVRHTCGIDNGGNLWCWGDNSFGELGVGDANARSLPTAVELDRTWSMVSAGEDATCGIDNAGDLYCWGNGDVVGRQSNVPVAISDPPKWIDVSVGREGFCAVTADNATYCSWDGAAPQRADADAPVAATSVAASRGRQCVLNEMTHQAYCWGNNDRLQVRNDVTDTKNPVEIPSQVGWDQIAAGPFTTCGIDRDSHLWCWGECSEYQNGLQPTGTPHCAPTQVGTDRYLRVAVGDEAACALDEFHEVVCFGHNDSGELGRATIEPWDLPGKIAATADFNIISVGAQHACATTAGDAHGYCWGSNAYGQLGTDEVAFQQAPMQVGAGSTWLAVSTGITTTCGIAADRTIWCWGSNGAGQLGEGTTTSRSAQPVEVESVLKNWYAVSVGASHVCALSGDTATGSTLYCWGSNQAGELGIGNTADVKESVPKQVGTKNDWVAIQAGTQRTCGIRNDPTPPGPDNQSGVYCWGGGVEFPTNLENGTPGYHSLSADANSTVEAEDMYVINGSALYLVPYMPPKSDTRYTTPSVLDQVARGFDHHCGLDAGTLWCWGLNESGQLGRDPGGPGDRSDTAIREQKMYTNWNAVDVAGHSTCAIRDGGTLFCWGSARTLGSPIPTGGTGMPTPLPGTWSSISLGPQYACGLHADGSLWCWGENALGELGDGPAGTDQPMRVKPGM